MHAPGRRGLGSTRGGTIINVLFAIIFFGLLAAGVLWVIKGFGDMGAQYNKAMVQATDNAGLLKCRMNMRSVWQCVESYETENDALPASREELVRFCGDSRVLRCDEPNGQPYVYVPGQRMTMPESNVLVYEPVAVHQGRAVVLFLHGRIGVLDPNNLKQAVGATEAQIRMKP
jgi:hypothetical protein